MIQQVNMERRKVKVTVNMSPDMVAALKVASFQRRSSGLVDSGLSELVREAVEEWLDREINGAGLMSMHG
ncbi:MAG: hypothetical protein GWP16_02685 [Nitrospirae bacterium]|nr:hypothetical protein [Nitrospirota bacterium]